MATRPHDPDDAARPEDPAPRPDPEDATVHLRAAAAGDADGAARVLDIVYQELHDLAGRAMRRERKDHTLQATELLNAAWIKLFDGSQATYNDRQHFLTVASNAMRQILVDHARGRLRLKRGGDWHRVHLTSEDDLADCAESDVIALDDTLSGLERESARAAQVVELRYFGGLSVEEVAAALDLSESTVAREWRFARAWLSKHLTPP